MNQEELKQVLDRMTQEVYDEPRGEPYLSMISEFYSRKMLGTTLLVWGNFLFFFGLGVGSAVMFFLSSEVYQQIMYAALFVCFMQWSTLIKVYAWQVMHKNQIRREIKRLELRVVELAQAVSAE